MVNVFYHNIGESPEEKVIELIFNSFPEILQSKILQYKKQEDRNRAVAGKALLTEAMKILGVDHRLDEMKFNEYHRPYFNDSFDFNISHSHDFVVCTISKTNRVGIDIEKIKPVVLNDFKNVFSESDWNKIISAEDQLHAFYYLWTKRESFLKALGKGFFQSSTNLDFTGSKVSWDGTEWNIREIKLHRDYSCHIAMDQPDAEIQLQEIKFD